MVAKACKGGSCCRQGLLGVRLTVMEQKQHVTMCLLARHVENKARDQSSRERVRLHPPARVPRRRRHRHLELHRRGQ